MQTQKGEIATVLFLLICIAAPIYWLVSAFDLTSLFVGRIAGYDTLVAEVDAASRAGNVAPEGSDAACKPLGALTRDFLQGKPVPNCNGAFYEDRTPLGSPVFIVDMDRQRRDAINRLLPAPLLAPDAQAASTLVLTHCSRRKSGSYGTLFPQTAYDLDCGMLFVARTGQRGMRILGLATIASSPPDEIDTRFSFGAVVADRPETQMANEIVFRFPAAAK
jgi:hypothetical protein